MVTIINLFFHQHYKAENASQSLLWCKLLESVLNMLTNGVAAVRVWSCSQLGRQENNVLFINALLLVIEQDVDKIQYPINKLTY